MIRDSERSPRRHRNGRVVLLLTISAALSGCVVTAPVAVATAVTVGAVKTTGAVAGAAVDVVTKSGGPQAGAPLKASRADVTAPQK